MGEIERPRGAPRIVPAVPMKYERCIAKSNSKADNCDASRVTSQGKSGLHRATGRMSDIFPATISSVQDYGIEKHGKLPPPFYPAAFSPTQASFAFKHGSPLPQELLEANGDETPAISPPRQVEHPQWTSPDAAYPANPTPPNDGSPTPFHYSVDAQTFRPQPTPPSDMTPSPTQSLLQH